MGLLDQKTRILDVVLTDRGRELLSKNLLEFSYFAFSDEGVNYVGYSGSLSASYEHLSASLDDYVHRSLAFEADQRTSDNTASDRRLETYLFTIPSRDKVLPEFRSSVDESGDVTLKRRYYTTSLSLSGQLAQRLKDPIAVIMRAAIERKTLEQRREEYGLNQQVARTERRISRNKSVIGLPIAKDFIVLSRTKALNVKTGLVESIDKARQLHKDLAQEEQGKIVSLPRLIEFVVGLDSVTVDLKLKGSEGQIESRDGFLIEVYESGSDGKIRQLFQRTVEDPISDSKLQDGFDSFLEVDIK
jgi:hypothetical protein